MPDYLIFRAVTPPGFNFAEYQKRSTEPIRYDCVTVVEADSPSDAINAIIAMTGFVAAGFVAIECTTTTYSTGEQQIAAGGKLVASKKSVEAAPNELPAADSEVTNADESSVQ